VEISSPKICASSVMLKKNLPKVNNGIMGENSPNLITLDQRKANQALHLDFCLAPARPSSA
jgi:hypothetical protein